MNHEFICDYLSEELSEDRKDNDDDDNECRPETNKIFINFTREYRHPAKDRFNHEKVKELFKYIRERSDLQEIKVSGWKEESKEYKNGNVVDDNLEECEYGDEEGDNDNDDNDIGYCDDDDDMSSRRGQGQRFAMSRDFWYRKLNTLKAQKLDEAALEAEDMPPPLQSPSDRDDSKTLKYVKYIKKSKIYSDDLLEKNEDVMEEIRKFEENVERTNRCGLKKNSINIYDNRECFKKETNN